MKRIGSLSIAVACLVAACARSGGDSAPAAEKDVPVDSADPVWSGQDLERQLDRIEEQIKAGVGSDSSVPRGDGRGKGGSETVRQASPDRNKSKKPRNTDALPSTHASGNGSS